MRRLLPLILIALPAGAEDLAGFSGLARVTCAAGGVGYAAARSVDMPGSGWVNRWRVELAVDVPASCLRALEVEGAWIRTSATSRGSYTIDVPTWGTIEILPGASDLRDAFRRAAPGSESRWQRFSLRQDRDALELLVLEPK